MSANVTSNYLGQSFDRIGKPLRGFSRDHALMKRVTPSGNVSVASLYPGLVVHPVSSDTFSPGMPNQFPRVVCELGSAVGRGLPLYLLNGTIDFDTSLSLLPAGVPLYGNAANPFAAISAMPTPPATATYLGILASGGFEFETTEFDTAQTYVAGQPLRTVTSNSSTDGGKVTNQGNAVSAFGTGTFNVNPTASSDQVVGYVSAGAYANAYMKTVLSYWTWFIPGTR